MDCLFCKIVEGKVPAKMVYQDEKVIAFRDINPQAPTHILVIPRKHIATINDLQNEDESLIGHMSLVAKNIASDEAISDNGYRLVFNVNTAGGQEVYHIHLHILGGRQLTWPPG